MRSHRFTDSQHVAASDANWTLCASKRHPAATMTCAVRGKKIIADMAPGGLPEEENR